MEKPSVPTDTVIDLTSELRQLNRRRDIELNIAAFLDDHERESVEALKHFLVGILGAEDEITSV